MAQVRESGIFNFVASASGSFPTVVATGGAMPEDPRSTGTVGSATDAGFLQFLPMSVLCSAAPSALSITNIATNQTGVTGVALALTAGTGITSGTIGATGVFFIDTAPATNPTTDITKNIARGIRVFSTGNDAAMTFTIKGYDLYSNAQSEVITGASGTSRTSAKCYKAIQSIVPSNSTATGVTVGTADLYAFPMRVDNFDEVIIYWNGLLVANSTGFTAADTTNPQTTTTGEPKGKYATQGSSSDGTRRLTMYQFPKSLTTSTTIFGITPA